MIARGALRFACAVWIGLGSGWLTIVVVLTFDDVFERLLPASVDGLTLLALPPFFAIAAVACSGRWRARAWVVSSLVVAGLCLLTVLFLDP